jgi:hypothetical protein
MTETLKAYRATKEQLSQKWVIQREHPCINGLSAWFTVATCHDSCEQEMGYSDGAIGSAEQRANQIADALNTRPQPSMPTREEVARMIDPKLMAYTKDDLDGLPPYARNPIIDARNKLYDTADSILTLFTPAKVDGTCMNCLQVEALAAAPPPPEAWRVKDFADGWVCTDDADFVRCAGRRAGRTPLHPTRRTGGKAAGGVGADRKQLLRR